MMPLRDRARAFFRPKSRTVRDSDSQSSSIAGAKDQTAPERNSDGTSRWPSNVYRPGEPMPRPKYRATPKKEHKEKLEAFNFAESWRRKSYQSQHSPMGTRAPSRRNSSSRQISRTNSVFSLAHRRKSDSGRTNSVTSADTTRSGRELGLASRKGRDRDAFGLAKPTPLETEPEHEGDDDVGNVGLSRVQSRDTTLQPKILIHREPQDSKDAGRHGTAPDHRPFTERDLSLALERSHLQIPAR